MRMKGITCCGDCGYYNWKKHKCSRAMNEGDAKDSFYADCPLPDVVIEQQPRVMTLEELKEYISLPPVFVDDLGEQEDYLYDIAPLYMDFPNPDTWDVHWRDVHMLRQNVRNAEQSYGKQWRVWTAKPTKEQMEAVKWD